MSSENGSSELRLRRHASDLRRELSARNVERARAHAHELTFGEVPSIIYSQAESEVHGNFLTASYRRICGTPQWSKRLEKVYTGSKWIPRQMDRRRHELDCATSSDALLMNVFCYPGVLRRTLVCAMLGVQRGTPPEFGFRPRTPLLNGRIDRTEIDLKLGNLLIESKLTENDFQAGRPELIRRYRDFDEVFEVESLPIVDGIVRSYQLVRNVLAAYALKCSFCVLCDGRRSDLIEDWYRIISSVRQADLRCQLRILTWQELARALPRVQQSFLEEKYGIVAI
jgi:Restriction Endonuclease associating with ARP